MSEYNGYLMIGEVEYSFFISGSTLVILPIEKTKRQFKPYSTNKFECVFGHLSTHQQVCLLDVVIQEGFMSRTCTVSAIIKGSRIMGEDISIEPIDSITFMGDIINRFYHHFRKIDIEKTIFDESDGSATIRLKPYSEITSSHDIQIGSFTAILRLSTLHLSHANIEKETILELKSTLDLHFEKPLLCKDLKEIYTALLNFFRFLNFRINIGFDRIVVKKIYNGIHCPIGELIMLAQKENSIIPTQRTIHYEDISSHIETLFKNVISSERYFLFAPTDNREAAFVNYWSYINATTSFEYFFRKSNKDSSDESFNACKQLILDRIADIDHPCLKILNKKIEDLDDTSLIKRFKDTFKMNKRILEKAFPKLDINKKAINSISNSFAEQRNKIGHGNTDDLANLDIQPYIIALCIIYIMILKESSIGDDSIVTILKNIFSTYELS